MQVPPLPSSLSMPLNGAAIAFVAADHRSAQNALQALKAMYNTVPIEEAEVIIALGGDGFMLETLHRYLSANKPIFGLNRGSVGFLMNRFDKKDLLARLGRAVPVALHPLEMICQTRDGREHRALAINEVSLLRETRQAAKLRLEVDGITRMAELVADGIILATAAGSTAYNLSASGSILPLGCNLLALTPLSPFRPRRWRGALLPHTTTLKIDVLESKKRPVSAVADFTEVRDIKKVEVFENRDITLRLLFDPDQHLEERIVKEQFQV